MGTASVVASVQRALKLLIVNEVRFEWIHVKGHLCAIEEVRTGMFFETRTLRCWCSDMFVEQKVRDLNELCGIKHE